MEIILLENIVNLGNIGDKVKLKMGMEEIFTQGRKGFKI